MVVGIGNIYASEILFAAKIDPLKKVNTLSFKQFKELTREIKRVLKIAIKYGGTTIKDHTDSSGKIGLFQNKLKVYGRSSKPCVNCRTKLITTKIGSRSTVFCPFCQKI